MPIREMLLLGRAIDLLPEFQLSGIYDTSATRFQHQDWPGTERMQTAYNHAVEDSFTSLAFGDGYTASSQPEDEDPYYFASLDHDYENRQPTLCIFGIE